MKKWNEIHLTKRKLKLDIDSGNGNKISVTFTGDLNRDKILQVLDIVNLLETNSTSKHSIEDLSKFDKLKLVIRRKFPIGWFSSQELMIAYEDLLDEPISLSTVSTYLHRLSKRKFLIRAGSFAERKYKLVSKIRRIAEI